MPDDSDLSLEVKTAEVKTAEVETVEVDEDLALQIARSLPRKGREQITCATPSGSDPILRRLSTSTPTSRLARAPVKLLKNNQ